MTKSKCWVVLGAVAIGMTLAYSVVAQNSGSTQPKRVPASVALVDVRYILSQNGAIDHQITQLQEKYSKQIQEADKERQEVAKLRDLLLSYDRNSDKYRETEQLMLSRSNDIGSRQMLIVKEWTEEQIQILNQAYSKVLMQTERIARHFGMTIVLNYDRQKLSDMVPLLPNPQQYEMYMQQHMQLLGTRTVVWADQKAVDLTALVLGEIQKADPTTIRKTDTTVKNGTLANPSARVGSNPQR